MRKNSFFPFIPFNNSQILKEMNCVFVESTFWDIEPEKTI